jgi:energy-coupling factor transport system permease protein
MRRLGYHPGHSVIHQLYPITKLAWLLFGSVLVFFITNGYLSLLAASTLLILLTCIHPNIWRVRGFRFTFSTGLGLFCLYLLFIKTGQTMIDPGIDLLKITSDGLGMGFLYSGRFFSIIFLSYCFILTTEPSGLAYALMRMGVPYRFGFMLVTALRLAPIMEEEGRTIYRAQLVRGIRYDHAGLTRIFLLTRQFLTPLLISALRRADHLFFSMEGRGFGRYAKRTFLKKVLPSWLDLYCTLGFLLFFAVLFILQTGRFL